MKVVYPGVQLPVFQGRSNSSDVPGNRTSGSMVRPLARGSCGLAGARGRPELGGEGRPHARSSPGNPPSFARLSKRRSSLGQDILSSIIRPSTPCAVLLVVLLVTLTSLVFLATSRAKPCRQQPALLVSMICSALTYDCPCRRDPLCEEVRHVSCGSSPGDRATPG